MTGLIIDFDPEQLIIDLNDQFKIDCKLGYLQFDPKTSYLSIVDLKLNTQSIDNELGCPIQSWLQTWKLPETWFNNELPFNRFEKGYSILEWD